MDLHDYDYPDAYAPDPRASQRVAAQQRAQPGRPTHDTEPIAPLKLNARRYVPFGIGALVLIVLMIGAASYQLGRLPTATPLAITPGPSTAAFLAAPTPSPAATTAPTATPRTIGAYAAPDGLLLGQIEEDREIIPVAHYGSAWVQADVHGSGRVWLRAQDVPDVAITGPDLAPVAAQPPQTGRGPNVSNEWTPPAPVAAPAFGSKPADDRAARHAAARLRNQQQPAHGSK